MRGRLTVAVALATVLAVACAFKPLAHAHPESTVYCPVSSYSCGSEGLEVSMSSGFKPARLPRKRLAPIHMSLGERIRTADGSHPPALKEVVLETDRNVEIGFRGLAVCRSLLLLEEVPNPCKKARVGEGEMEVEVAFPESAPFIAKSHMVAFNGGKRDGAKTILIYGYLKNPVSAAIVVRVKVSKIHHGRFGTKLVATIPTIAGGHGSVTSFNFKLFRKFTYRHKKRSFLSARCVDGKLLAHWEAVLASGPDLTGAFMFPCTQKG
ncbi:MAG: hypothetical protein ACM3N0_00770 [Chloroflexota bacterium]